MMMRWLEKEGWKAGLLFTAFLLGLIGMSLGDVLRWPLGLLRKR